MAEQGGMGQTDYEMAERNVEKAFALNPAARYVEGEGPIKDAGDDRIDVTPEKMAQAAQSVDEAFAEAPAAVEYFKGEEAQLETAGDTQVDQANAELVSQMEESQWMADFLSADYHGKLLMMEEKESALYDAATPEDKRKMLTRFVSWAKPQMPGETREL